MNLLITLPEIAVVAVGLGLLLLDLWTPQPQKRNLGFVAIALLVLILVGTFFFNGSQPQYAFGQMYVLDSLALFFKRFFLVAALFVLVMTMDYAKGLEGGIVEYYALTLFALSGMMWAASVNDFTLLFVSVELMAITFYILVSYHRSRLDSLEAGVKYLILSAVASAFLIYGIACIYGSAGTFSFVRTEAPHWRLIFQLGLTMVLVGLGFKIAAFPFQIWVPDVYQGAPTPTTAFLAIGSKAAGFALVLRLLASVAPELTPYWKNLLLVIAAVTILYGNLCAIPQRNLKRLLGYSSIANAGYLLLGVVALSANGTAATLYYLGGYLFTLASAFTVIAVAIRETDSEDIGSLAGLHYRSPLMAATLCLAMVSLAGIPPLAGFFGKFLLLKAVIEKGATQTGYFWLVGVALVGIAISLYYYLGVVRALYWAKPSMDRAPIVLSAPVKCSLWICLAAMLYLGILPSTFLGWVQSAARVLKW